MIQKRGFSMSSFRVTKSDDQRAWSLAVVCLLSLAVSSPAASQTKALPLALDQEATPSWSGEPSSIQGKAAPEIEALIQQIRVRDFSPEETDDIYLFALAKPEVTLPILERILADGLRSQSLAGHKVAQLRDFVAYAGNEESLRVLSRLHSEFDEPRLNGGVVSLLYYTESRRNPFLLAYSPDALSGWAIEEVLTWVQQKAAHPEGIRDWAEALLARQDGIVDVSVALEEDPIASQVHDSGVLAALRKEVERQRRDSLERHSN